MKTNYFKRILATGLAALSMMSIFATASVTANAATVKYDQDAVSIEIPDSVTSIGDYEFKDFKKLETVYIGKNVKSISPTAFIGCPNIRRFNVATENKYFRADDCKYLTSYHVQGAEMKTLIRVATGELHRNGRRYEVPAYICEIGDYAFDSAFSAENYLNELRIGNNVVSIGNHAFDGCQAANVIIGENVRFVDSYAFANNDLIEKLSLTYNLNSVGSYAFTGCKKLASVSVNNPMMKTGLDPFAGAAVSVNRSKEIIAFDVNGGSILAIPDNILFDNHSMNNQLISASVEPKKSGYVFTGWYDNSGNEYRINDRLNENKSVILYAKWEGKTTKTASGQSSSSYIIVKSKAETTTTTKQTLDFGQETAPAKNKINKTDLNEPAKKAETTTAPTTVKAEKKAAIAVSTGNKTYVVKDTTTAAEKTDAKETEAKTGRSINDSYSIVKPAERNSDNTESTSVKTAETHTGRTSAGSKTESGKKLNVFERIIAFFKSLFSDKH